MKRAQVVGAGIVFALAISLGIWAIGASSRRNGRHDTLTKSSPEREGAASTKSERGSHQLAEKVALLEQRLAMMEQRNAEFQRMAGTASAEPTRSSAENPQQLVEESRARNRRLEQRLDSKLATEALDPQWADQQTIAVRDLLARPELRGAELQDTSCRSTVCRITIRDVSGEGSLQDRIQSVLVSTELGKFDSWLHSGENGDTVLYIAKEEGSPMRQVD